MTGAAAGVIETPVGRVGVLAGRDGIVGCGWQERHLLGLARSGRGRGESSPSPSPSGREQLERGLEQLAEYFAGTRRQFALELDLCRLGASSQSVLRALYETVGFGETVTYGELARRSGSNVPARAIGSIMGANPIPLIIPCHRVVSADGLGGFSGGEPGREGWTKSWLLEHEGVLPEPLF